MLGEGRPLVPRPVRDRVGPSADPTIEEAATDTERSPDPVTEPKAYQDHLLGLLGDDDPAQVQSDTPAAIRTLVSEAASHLRTRPRPGEWSVLECIAHVADAEIVMAGRYRFILAHNEPPLIGYDQDLWVDRLHSDEEEVEALLGPFEALRASNVALWRGSAPEQRARVGMHAERGPESFDLSFRMLAGHDRFHLAQARRALSAVGER
jgi:hypothetical protein